MILDALSYIKGFRYQLFCEAKGNVTPHCIVHVIALLRNVSNGMTPRNWEQMGSSFDETVADEI